MVYISFLIVGNKYLISQFKVEWFIWLFNGVRGFHPWVARVALKQEHNGRGCCSSLHGWEVEQQTRSTSKKYLLQRHALPPQ